MKFDACSTHHPIAANLVIVSASNENKEGWRSAQTSVLQLKQKRFQEALRIKANNPDLSEAFANVKLYLGIREGRVLLATERMFWQKRRKKWINFYDCCRLFQNNKDEIDFENEFSSVSNETMDGWQEEHSFFLEK